MLNILNYLKVKQRAIGTVANHLVHGMEKLQLQLRFARVKEMESLL
jgi:hypothetical protein